MSSNGTTGYSTESTALRRREFLRIGLSGFAALSLPGLFRVRAENGLSAPRRPKSVILVWLRGGMSHLESYDPKPEAPSEFRGVFGAIPTRVPGMHLSELLPLHAQCADKFTLIRSLSHTGGGHPAGSLQMLTGDTDPNDKQQAVFPDWMTVANFLKARPGRQIPNYIGVNPVHQYDGFKIAGSAYVSPAYGPFVVSGDPSAPHFEVPNLKVEPAEADRLVSRTELRKWLDQLNRAVDRSGTMKAMDDFELQALNLLTSPAAREAFDLSKEDERTRDRYGRNQWGQQCLMARRLAEAGVEIITTTFDGPLCGRVQNWDDHGVNQHIFDVLQFRMPTFDKAVTALIEDIYERGLDQNVLVVVTGEFGRTPRIATNPSSGEGVGSGPTGTMQPGRDHWPQAFSQLWAGGGIETGRVIGATDAKGEEVIERRCGPHDFLATLYHHLGIDGEKVTLPDFNGRPVPLVSYGSPIRELLG